MEQSTPIPISSLFAGTIEALSAVAAARSPRERAAILRAIQTLRRTQVAAEKLPPAQVASDVAPRLASGITEPDSLDKKALAAWGADLMEHRKSAGLSRETLAARAGISDSTLRDVEKGRRPPTRTTILHLQSVPELRIEAAPPQYTAGSEPKESGFAPNCWLAPV